MSNQFNYQSTGTKQSKHLDFKPFESIISDSLYINSNKYQFHYHQYTSSYPLINHVGINIDTDNDIDIDNIVITEDYDTPIPHQSSANFPLFFNHKNKIKIPTKIEFALRRYTPRGLLRDIHPDIDVAIMGIGAYSPEWFMHSSHMNPEDSWKAFTDLGAKRFFPMHFGTFDLADEPMGEPS